MNLTCSKMTEYIKNYFSSSLKTFSILKTRILTKKCEKSKKYSKSIILYDSKKKFFFSKFEFITSCTCVHFRVEFKYAIVLLIIMP